MALHLSQTRRSNRQDSRAWPASATPLCGGTAAFEANLSVAAWPCGCRPDEFSSSVVFPHEVSPRCVGSNRTSTGKRHPCINVARCRIVWRLVSELFTAASERALPEAALRRRPRCHMRQIAMYLSHVVLSVPYQTIATAFDRDRTTVTHACSVIEDRRDDPGYDRFVEQCERCVTAVFAPLGQDHVEF